MTENQNTAPAEFMTTSEVARVLGVSHETVVKMIQASRLPVLSNRLTGEKACHRIPRAEFMKWVAERTQGAS